MKPDELYKVETIVAHFAAISLSWRSGFLLCMVSRSRRVDTEMHGIHSTQAVGSKSRFQHTSGSRNRFFSVMRVFRTKIARFSREAITEKKRFLLPEVC